MKKISSLFILFISITLYGQDYQTVDNVVIQNNIYEVQAKYEPSSFVLKIIDGTNSTESGNIINAVDSTVFFNIFKQLVLSLDSAATFAVPETTAIEGTRTKISKKREALKSVLQKTTETIDGEPIEYSGTITLNNIVKIKTTDSDECGDQKQKILGDSEPVLNINKAYISFFNNKASTIVLEGKIDNDSTKKIVIVNNDFSVPVRYFNNYGSTNSFSINNDRKKCFEIDYNDVFDYGANQHFNYSIANSELHFKKDTLVRSVRQRSFFDFFTAVLFTDALALDQNNSNSLINAQAKLLIPINQRNIGKWSFIRQMLTEVNIALYNGSSDNTRIIESKDGSTFSNFDLLKKSNLNGKLNLDLISHEAKGYFSYISLGYNATFHRTAFKQTTTVTGQEDSVETAQLFSLSHGPVINVEIRPQTNFGADISASLENLTYNNGNEISGTNIESLMTDKGFNHFGFKYNVVNVKADFYWLTNPTKGKKGGIFARIGGFYHTQSYNIYPQLMVGYATNLTSFVNRFKPQK
ncbi:hypothetical protein [uncultured Lacinutrix sp.]|uniref:hypothetical protein n=1 Tax=uncultured Lacinutrix sp. TaxID=574032 RepID=UPI0026287DAF|nr:hypothetical protein [uncultured Lacinutrix sp.]